MTTRSPVSTRMPAPSAPRMRGFGTDGRPLRIQTSRWFSEAATEDGRAPRRAPAQDPGATLVAQHLRPAVLVDTNGFIRAQFPTCRAAELGRLAEGASASTSSERRRFRPTRRPSGTSANGARAASSPTCASRWRTRSARAIPSRCSRARAPSSRRRSAITPTSEPPPPGHGACRAIRGGTPTPRCGCLDGSGGTWAASTAASSWTRTSTVDRRGGRSLRSRFYGKNTMLITRRFGSWWCWVRS